MDITRTKNKITTSKLINGETVNYSAIFSLGFVLFLVIKQIMKTIFGISASVALPVSFSICLVASFFLERKYVFNHSIRTKKIMSYLLFLFRCAVDFGFFKILDFALVDMLKLGDILPYLISGVLIFFFNYYFDKLLVFDSVSVPKNNKNGKTYKLFFDNRYILVSILLALAGILFVFAIFSLFPIGDFTVLRMDLYHQYGPLFVELYDRVVHFKSFIYSWESGGGSSFLGNFFNYLASPISALIFLFDRDQIGYAITTLVIVKGVLSSASFTYFLKKSFGAHSFASASFGVLYAFSGYFLAYYWNIMWIDGMILVPFIALGIERIINEGKGKTYIISLALLLYSSYYMGYMACIFSVLYFFVYYIAHHDFDEKISINNKTPRISNRFLHCVIKFGICSILVGAICAIFLIPVYFILQASSATKDTFPSSFTSYFDLFDLLGQHLAGLETTIRSSGDDVLPNIYCGILPVLLIPLYLANKNISLKEKLCYVLFIIFFIFSFDNNVMNFIWNAFHTPNDLPYRFSYLYVFIFLIMAFRGLMEFKGINYRDIMFVGIGTIIVILLIQKMPTNKISEFSIYLSLAFTMIWTLVLLMIKQGKISKFVIGITIICMTFSEVIITDSSEYTFTQPQTPYVANMESYENTIDIIENNDSDFYRVEQTKLNTRMDSCLYGYNGMSVFSSMAYEKYSRSQYSLGMYGNRINSFTYNTQTPIYNMMFNIKYLIKANNSNTPSGNYYTQFIESTDDSTKDVYENNYYLPIAFLVPDTITDWDNTEGNPFDVQESLIDNAAGVSNVFVPVEYVSTDSIGADCDEVTENGTYVVESKSSSNTGGEVNITIKATKDSNVYVYISSSEIESVNYYWDDGESNTYQSISTPYIMDLGYHNAGDEIKISLDLSNLSNGGGSYKIYSYCVDDEVLDSAYEMLSQGAIDVTKHSETKIEGNVNCGYDGYLYTSIPYDEGWNVTVDGVETQTEKLVNCQMIIPITAGEHEIKMTYKPKGLLLGVAISGVSIIALAGYEILKHKNKLDNFLYKLEKQK